LNEEDLYVSHFRLSIHFIAALGLLCYTLWFALKLMVKPEQGVVAPSLQKFTNGLLVLLVVQLVFGAFMAGLKAANFATTWPLINGEFIPSSLSNDTFSSFTHDPLAVHFIHRNLAYIITILVIIWFMRARKIQGGKLFEQLKSLPVIMILLQVLLGIFTVLYANNPTALLWLGVAHQFTGMMFLLLMVTLIFLIRRR
jgi:cytochrome c oxidase assembly protein subunit 15